MFIKLAPCEYQNLCAFQSIRIYVLKDGDDEFPYSVVIELDGSRYHVSSYSQERAANLDHYRLDNLLTAALEQKALVFDLFDKAMQ